MRRSLPIQIARLMGEIEHLSLFSDAPPPAVTRVLYSPVDMAARAHIKQLANASGLLWRTDSIGNTFMRWVGSEPQLPPVATGSHIDAVPYSGKYDGVVGVLGALEAIRSLQSAGYQPRRTIELILFTAEEPTRFGLGCLGSRALAGELGASLVDSLQDSEGIGFYQARREAGFEGDVEATQLPRGYYHAFVELHIEQGPVLKQAEIPIGVVTAIAASSTSEVSFGGDGGHAGTVPMALRHDPLPAAAELALLAEQIALENGQDAVATVGKFSVYPGASNSIPRQVQMSLDIRHVDANVRDAMVESMRSATQRIGQKREVTSSFQTLNADRAMSCDPLIVERVIQAAMGQQLPYLKLVSRAYHDTVFMGAICPVGMIFIPCTKGYSHRPDEYTPPQEIAQGVQVLAMTLATLAEGSWG